MVQFRIWIFFILLILGGFQNLPLQAQDTTPYYIRNQNPFVRIFGIPAAESGSVAPAQSFMVGLVGDATNNFTSGYIANEEIFLDSEIYVTKLILRYGLFEKVEVGLDLPYVYSYGGFLDTPVENWHTAFNFGTNGRPESPRDRIRYRYALNDKNLLVMEEEDIGWGDIRLSTAYQLVASPKNMSRNVVLRAGVKFPTGESSTFLGSDSMDFTLGLSGSELHNFYSHIFSFFGTAGAAYLGKGKILSSIQNQLVLYASIGTGWSPSFFPRLTGKIQVDGHTPVYNSRLVEIGQVGALQVGMGGTVILPWKTKVDLVVTEDLLPGTASDLGLHMSLQQPF